MHSRFLAVRLKAGKGGMTGAIPHGDHKDGVYEKRQNTRFFPEKAQQNIFFRRDNVASRDGKLSSRLLK
jgi:hypothetical protein